MGSGCLSASRYGFGRGRTPANTRSQRAFSLSKVTVSNARLFQFPAGAPSTHPFSESPEERFFGTTAARLACVGHPILRALRFVSLAIRPFDCGVVVCRRRPVRLLRPRGWHSMLKTLLRSGRDGSCLVIHHWYLCVGCWKPQIAWRCSTLIDGMAIAERFSAEEGAAERNRRPSVKRR